jgi:hypothetical protein
MLEEGKMDLAIILGGMISILQPLDVSLNKPFKNMVKKLYTDWLCSEDQMLTTAGRVKRASLSQVCAWINVV